MSRNLTQDCPASRSWWAPGIWLKTEPVIETSHYSSAKQEQSIHHKIIVKWMTKYLPSRIIRHIDGNYRCLCWLYVCEQGAGHFCGLNGNIKKECLKIFLMEPTLCVTNLGAASVMNVTSVTRLWRFQWTWIIKCYEQISRVVIIIDALFFPDGHGQHDVDGWVGPSC